ncbi:hypothetical protein DFH05DRAFT_969734 [Lentinula detonsa]|uniref:Uncharacterized protein n=1 Tax=Lentinula detonsa TaxID=2804962 RepID=A0A9W8TZF4_9AGAR|nr:hypothetical protein DFH05DRAFT_969734 [Lentinula detonsa]
MKKTSCFWLLANIWTFPVVDENQIALTCYNFSTFLLLLCSDQLSDQLLRVSIWQANLDTALRKIKENWKATSLHAFRSSASLDAIFCLVSAVHCELGSAELRLETVKR